MKTKVDDDGQIIVSIKGKKSGKNYGTTTLGEIQQASNAYHGEHNPYAKETRDKVKGQEHISGSEFYESGEE
jgi:hypothetical protein